MGGEKTQDLSRLGEQRNGDQCQPRSDPGTICKLLTTKLMAASLSVIHYEKSSSQPCGDREKASHIPFKSLPCLLCLIPPPASRGLNVSLR